MANNVHYLKRQVHRDYKQLANKVARAGERVVKVTTTEVPPFAFSFDDVETTVFPAGGTLMASSASPQDTAAMHLAVQEAGKQSLVTMTDNLVKLMEEEL